MHCFLKKTINQGKKGFFFQLDWAEIPKMVFNYMQTTKVHSSLCKYSLIMAFSFHTHYAVHRRKYFESFSVR